MKEDISTTETVPSDTARLGGATRFALTCVVLGFSYFSIRGCLAIPNFQVIFQDMLGSETSLPWITKFVLSCRLVFLAVSIGIPVLGIALLFSRDIARSLYILGAAMLVYRLDTSDLRNLKLTPVPASQLRRMMRGPA